MNHQTMLRDAEEEVSARAQAIAQAQSLQDALEEYSEAHGYTCCLYDFGVFDREQFNAAGDAISAAVGEAKKRMKKSAPGVASTGSGSNEGRPVRDENLLHNSSVDENPPDVKAGGTTSQGLAYTLYKLIRSMQDAKISASEIVFLLLATLHPEKGGESAC